jgi:hypothetical protein
MQTNMLQGVPSIIESYVFSLPPQVYFSISGILHIMILNDVKCKLIDFLHY